MPTEAQPLQARRLSRAERERRVLDAAAELFYARGVHEVGMDELIAATGLGKATVYRLFPTKDALIGAYLRRLADHILGAIDQQIARHRDDPAAAVRAIFAAISQDLARPGFRGCAFNNASIEFADPGHPARVAARDYRAELHRRLSDLAVGARPDAGPRLGAQLAVLIDGMYTSAAHLGPHGPAATGPALADALLRGRV
jgi:AcrR family transcriptional regulator